MEYLYLSEVYIGGDNALDICFGMMYCLQVSAPSFPILLPGFYGLDWMNPSQCVAATVISPR